MAGDLVPMCLSPERANLMARGLPLNVINPFSLLPSTRGLYGISGKCLISGTKIKDLFLFSAL